MDEILTLKDGTEIEGHTLESGDALFVYLTGGADMRTCFDMFIEPKNTETILENRFGEKSTHTGYTDLHSISKDYGNINIILRKG